MRTKTHDPTRGGLCPCEQCDLDTLARLANSRANSAIQASAWRPRSKKLAAAAARAIVARDEALCAAKDDRKAEDCDRIQPRGER